MKRSGSPNKITMYPLKECTILVTRSVDQSREVVDRIRELGGSAVCVPMIEVTEPASWNECDRSIVNITKYNGIIFTSANAVRGFVSRIENNFPHVKDVLGRLKIYSVGEKTKEVLLQYGLRTDAVPDEFTAHSMVEMISDSGAAGKTFLLPAGNLTRDVIEKGLRNAGAVVDRVQVYTVKKPENSDPVRLHRMVTGGDIDIVTFFSPSGAHHFFELIDPELLSDIPVAVIGDTTFDAVAGYGILPEIKPGKATGIELVNRIAEYIINKIKLS